MTSSRPINRTGAVSAGVQHRPLPTTIAGVDAAWIGDALGTRVNDLTLHGSQTGTAARLFVEVDYADPTDLPRRLCVKGGFDAPEYEKRSVTYRHEVRAYGELLPMVDVYRPACYFSAIDETNGQGVLILEDVVSAGGTANGALDAPTVDEAADWLDTLADLHASTWDAPLLDQLPWLTVSLAEDDTLAHWWDVAELERYLDEEGRGEVVDPSLQNPKRLLEMFASLAPYAAARPRAVLHGDTHIGNTYRSAAGEAAFLDWQGVTQGQAIRDVSYFLASNLITEDRRAHERDLLAHYLDSLAARGAEAPPPEQAWTEYRRWLLVPLLVWIRNSDLCQPRAANRLGAERCSTAFMDLDAADLFA